MIQRLAYSRQLATAMRRSRITAILGPRQSGKTTLARAYGEQTQASYFDLESPRDANRLQNPQLALSRLKGVVILDEIQTMPSLFSLLRVLVDRPGNRARILILGSASPDIIRNVSESLAGRVEFIELMGFGLDEVETANADSLWLRGGFPRSYLAKSEKDSVAWREGFIQTFLNRDIPQLGIAVPPAAMRRFWTMLAHYHGQVWNASELARSLDVSDKTVRSYLDTLSGTFMVRQLQPWFENVGKRQVKAPKIYLRDSGILHSLLSLPDMKSLLGHPRLGASWEGFAIEHVLRTLKLSQSYFWSTYSGAELDLFLMARGKRYGVECKFTETPTVKRSMHESLRTLSLRHLYVVYPGAQAFPMDKKITAWPLSLLPELKQQLHL